MRQVFKEKKNPSQTANDDSSEYIRTDCKSGLPSLDFLLQIFLAVQDSSLGNLGTQLVTQSVNEWVVYLLISVSLAYDDYKDYSDHNDYHDYNDYNDYNDYKD